MTNTKELKMLYKAETSNGVNHLHCRARVGKYGNVILDGFDLDDDWRESIGKSGKNICLPDMDYVAWLESKVMELLP